MSRSCHSATFSSAAIALARTSRARPVICSHPIGLRLCGIADEPFCPRPNGSSTSPISVFCSPRISSANFSSDAARIASAVISSACRSRWMTCDDDGRRREPERLADGAPRSTDRGARTCRRRPTSCRRTRPRARGARARGRARPRRTRARASRRTSSARRARRASGRSSACGDAPRPRRRIAAASASRSARIRSHASRICSASAVSSTSDDVRPKCSQRAAGPTRSATAVVNAMTSCCVVCSISSMRAMSNCGFLAQGARVLDGHDARGRQRVGGRQLHVQPGVVLLLVAPDRAHLGMGVARNHSARSSS